MTLFLFSQLKFLYVLFKSRDLLNLLYKIIATKIHVNIFYPQIFSLTDDSEVSGDGKKKGQKKKTNKSKAAQRKNSKKSSEQQTGNDLSAKIFATMEKHKEVFFVIRLHSAQSAASLAVSINFIVKIIIYFIFFFY